MKIIDYDPVLQRYTAYKASTFRDIRSLAKTYCQAASISQFNRVSQANTEGSQCTLGDDDIVLNFVENRVVGDLAQMLPPGATDREVLDEVKLGGVSLAELIHWASDAQWARVIDGRGRLRARHIFARISEAAENAMDCYHIRLINDEGNLLQGFITHHHASQHIEDALAVAAGRTITVWSGYEKANVLNHIVVSLPE